MNTKIRIWDVEHGSAAHITTPSDKKIVVDMGNSSDVSPLTVLKGPPSYYYTPPSIDLLIVTHPHYDHISDIKALDGWQPRSFNRPSHLTVEDIVGGHFGTLGEEAKQVLQRYLDMDSRYTNPVYLATDPTEPVNNGGVQIRTFHPRYCDRSNINNHSVVTIVEYAGVKVLIPGDNEACSWEELLLSPDFLIAVRNTHVLVAAHHGRESGYYAELFEYISPVLTIVSDGRVVDTSATSRYSTKSEGWKVHKRLSGTQETRYCLTTRNDGNIDIEFGFNNGGRKFLSVTID